jgi:hypothetical protein
MENSGRPIADEDQRDERARISREETDEPEADGDQAPEGRTQGELSAEGDPHRESRSQKE